MLNEDKTQVWSYQPSNCICVVGFGITGNVTPHVWSDLSHLPLKCRLEVLRHFISLPKFLREKLGNYLVNAFGRAKVGRPMSVNDGLSVIFDQGNRGDNGGGLRSSLVV